MKYCLLLLLIWLFINTASAQMEPSFIIEDTLCTHTERPLLLKKGAVVTVGCDSAYLINSSRYFLYQRLHQHMREVSLAGNCQPIISAYEKALLETQASYESLHQQYSLTDQLAGQWMQESKQVMEQMQQTLQQAEQRVAQANLHLAEVRQVIKEERRRSLASKALIGLGGMGIGLLTAVLLIP